MENPLWFFWIFKDNYFLEHLLLSRMLFTCVALQIKLYSSEVVLALVWILNFIFYLAKIAEFWKFLEFWEIRKSTSNGLIFCVDLFSRKSKNDHNKAKYRRGSRNPAISKMELFFDKRSRIKVVNYCHKELHPRCFSCPFCDAAKKCFLNWTHITALIYYTKRLRNAYNNDVFAKYWGWLPSPTPFPRPPLCRGVWYRSQCWIIVYEFNIPTIWILCWLHVITRFS